MKKTIKLIELLNKIANGEEVPNIKTGDRIYEFCTTNFAHNDSGHIIFGFNIEDLNDEVEILDVEDEFEDIEELNKSEYQYSQCPSWNDREEVIRIMNCNFELHQKAIRDIIDNQKKIINLITRANNND